MIFNYTNRADEAQIKGTKPKTISEAQKRLKELVPLFEEAIQDGDRLLARKRYVEWVMFRSYWLDYHRAQENEDVEEDEVITAAICSKPGIAPRWLEAGEFVADVDGIRALCDYEPTPFGMSLNLNAVDKNLPWMTDTGYRYERWPYDAQLEKGYTVSGWAHSLIVGRKMKPLSKQGIDRLKELPKWIQPREGTLHTVGGQTQML